MFTELTNVLCIAIFLAPISGLHEWESIIYQYVNVLSMKAS